MKKILSITIMFLVVLPAISVSTPQAKAESSSLVGYWKFDEGSGTVATDSSGNGNTGTLMNGPQWVDGISGKALKFDGTDDYLSASDSPSLDVSGNQITVMFWMKPASDIDASTPYQKLYDKGDAYHSAIGGGGMRFTIAYVHDIDSVRKTWSGDTWYHIAHVYDGSTIRIYVDGVLDNSEPETGSIHVTSLPFTIAAYTYGGKWYFPGTIDEFRIYDYALTPEEIWNDYTRELCTLPWKDDFDYETKDDMKAAGWILSEEERISVGEGVVTLDNDGTHGCGVKYLGHFPSGIYDFTVEAKSRWIGRAYGQRIFYVWTQRHRYGWYGDGYYPEYSFIRYSDGWSGNDEKVLRFGGYAPVINEWTTFTLEKKGNTFYMYENGILKNTYTETDSAPDELVAVSISGCWISTVEYDYISISTDGLDKFASYRKLAEVRALAYGAFADLVYRYSSDCGGGRYDVTTLVQAFEGVIPVVEDLIESSMYELDKDVINQLRKTKDTIVSYKQWLDTLGQWIEDVTNWLIYGASAQATYDHLLEMQSLCEQEALAWESMAESAITNTLDQEASKISEISRYARDFQTMADATSDETAQGVADFTRSFVTSEMSVISHTLRAAKNGKLFSAKHACLSDLHIYDSLGRHSGPLYDTNGEVLTIEQGIPGAYHLGSFTDPQFVYLFDFDEQAYQICIVDRGDGSPSDYTLTLTYYNETGDLVDEACFANSISQGETQTLTFDTSQANINLQVNANLKISPSTLNLASMGRWITAYIEISQGFDLNRIVTSSILLNDTIPVSSTAPLTFGDYDENGIPDLMVKFERADVISYILANVNVTQLIEEKIMTITLAITGYLDDDTMFQGSDTIKVIYRMRGGPGRHTLRT